MNRNKLSDKQFKILLPKILTELENGNLLQYSCLENSMDGGAWWATVHGVTKSWTQLSEFMTTIEHFNMELENIKNTQSKINNSIDKSQKILEGMSSILSDREE